MMTDTNLVNHGDSAERSFDPDHFPQNPTSPWACKFCLRNPEVQIEDWTDLELCLKHRVLMSLKFRSLNYTRHGLNFEFLYANIVEKKSEKFAVLHVQRNEDEPIFSYLLEEIVSFDPHLYVTILRRLLIKRQEQANYYYLNSHDTEHITRKLNKKLVNLIVEFLS